MNLVRRAGTLMMGEGAARAVGLVTAAILARTLGVADFGILSFALNLAALLAVAIDMGQSSLIGRMIPLDPSTGPRAFVNIASNKLVLTAAFSTLAAMGTLSLTRSPKEAWTVGLMVAWGGSLSVFETLRAVSRAQRRFHLDSTANSLESLLRLALILIAAALGWGVVGFAAVYLLEAMASTALFALHVGRHTDLHWRLPSPKSSLQVLREAFPLGIVSLGMAGFYRLDQVLLRLLSTPTQTGLYAAASRVTLALNIVSTLVMWAAYPELVALRDNHREYRRVLLNALVTVVASGIALSSACMLLAADLVTLLFGRAFLDAGHLLRILAPVILLNSLTTVAMIGANALGREWRVARTVLALTALTALANTMLIPLYGATAAAGVSVGAEAIMATALFFVIRDRLPGHATSAETSATTSGHP